MQIEFEVRLKPEDLYRFNMYQMYTGIHGWISIVLGIAMLVLTVYTFGTVEMTYTLLYAVFGILFLFYAPVTLKLRSRQSIAASEELSKPLHYVVDADGFKVSQGEASAELGWNQIYKMVATKRNVLVYSSRKNAYVIPREQLGENYQALSNLAKEKLEKFRVKMK